MPPCNAGSCTSSRAARLLRAGLLVGLGAASATGAAAPIDSDARPYSHRVWQSADGLPEDLAQAVAQTPDGYLWVGTSGGLVRFDGVRFTVFNHENEPAFHDDSVYSLATSRDGTLWAGTEGGGLVRYAGGRFRRFGAEDGLTNGFVRVVFEDGDSRIWIGTDSGLFRVEGERVVRVDGRDGIAEMNVHAICEDADGRLLVGGWGLLVLSNRGATHYHSPGSLADNSIRTIKETANGDVWIGTISGLRRLRGGLRGDPFPVPRLIDGINICALLEGRGGELWIGTYGHGVMRFEGGRLTQVAARPSVLHDNVLTLFEDREDDVWIGTQGGLLRLAPSAAATLTAADGAPLSINTVYQDPEGPLLVAALNGRLFEVADHVLRPARLPASLAGVPVRNAFRDRAGGLWIGTDGMGAARIASGAVSRFDMRSGLVNDFVRAFCEDGEGGIWIGTDGGLSRHHGGAFRNYTAGDGLRYGSVRALLVDRRQRLWVATERGLARLENGAFVEDAILEPLRQLKVWALHEDADGGLWIGTHGAGLFYLRDGRLAQVTARNGLPSDKIHFITEDNRGTLWMSGTSGIVSVSRQELERVARDPSAPVAVRVFGTADGLGTNQMNGGVQPAGAITPEGHLWFPSTRGAVRIVPEAPGRQTTPLPVLIEDVRADGQAVPFAAGLDLPPGEGKLEIHYTSIRLRAPERIRFRYWMEGFESGWTEAGQRRIAYYTNLPAGRYRFHVRAYESDAPDAPAERTLDIVLRPHFYETSWFLALCGLALGAVAWAAYRLHVRGLRREFAAVLNERTRLAREMHDTLIQGCTGVSALLEAASGAKEVSPHLTHELLDRARAEVRATVDEARAAVWDLRHGTPDGEQLVPALSRLARRIGTETGVTVRFESAGAPFGLGADAERHIMMLVREALQNAIRHAAPNRLSVVVRYDRRRLQVEIEDDGCGFDSSVRHSLDRHHYGLVGMRERVEKLGGDFHLTSAPGKGTQVRFDIPAARTEGPGQTH